ncbi:MAG: helix-turn-helix domain-containing protein [Nitrospiraceae bacterium]
MGRYQRMHLIEREELSRMLAAGASLRAIGQALRRAPSTLPRELTRYHASPVTDRAMPAHQRAQRRVHQPRKLAIHPRLRTAVFRFLAQR